MCEGNLDTTPPGQGWKGNCPADGPGLQGAAPGRVQPGRFYELGCAVGTLGGVTAALGTATVSVPLQQTTTGLVTRVSRI